MAETIKASPTKVKMTMQDVFGLISAIDALLQLPLDFDLVYYIGLTRDRLDDLRKPFQPTVQKRIAQLSDGKERIPDERLPELNMLINEDASKLEVEVEVYKLPLNDTIKAALSQIPGIFQRTFTRNVVIFEPAAEKKEGKE